MEETAQLVPPRNPLGERRFPRPPKPPSPFLPQVAYALHFFRHPYSKLFDCIV
ncbi:MAG: hypothetical protein HYW48_08280 [Deltaproteobacteria bacterium]|nr:hypothetical protein [Deltaproteobacteria bacterium]